MHNNESTVLKEDEEKFSLLFQLRMTEGENEILNDRLLRLQIANEMMATQLDESKEMAKLWEAKFDALRSNMEEDIGKIEKERDLLKLDLDKKKEEMKETERQLNRTIADKLQLQKEGAEMDMIRRTPVKGTEIEEIVQSELSSYWTELASMKVQLAQAMKDRDRIILENQSNNNNHTSSNHNIVSNRTNSSVKKTLFTTTSTTPTSSSPSTYSSWIPKLFGDQ